MKYRPFWCNIDHKFKNIDQLSKMVDYRPMVDNIDPLAALQLQFFNCSEKMSLTGQWRFCKGAPDHSVSRIRYIRYQINQYSDISGIGNIRYQILNISDIRYISFQISDIPVFRYKIYQISDIRYIWFQKNHLSDISYIRYIRNVRYQIY